MHMAHAAHRTGGDGRAVIGVLARDDDLALRLAFQCPIVPNEADGGVVRFRTRRAEEDLIEILGRDLGELARELYDRRMRGAKEGVVVRQLEHLPVGRLGQFLVAVPDICRPQARHAVEDAVALAVPNVGPVAADDNAGAARTKRVVIGEGMKVVKSVELSQLCGLVCVGHGTSLQQKRSPKGAPISARSRRGAYSRSGHKAGAGAASNSCRLRPWLSAARPRPRPAARSSRAVVNRAR